MKSSLVPTRSGIDTADSQVERHGRRGLVVGAGVAAAAALAAVALQRKSAPKAAVADAEPAKAPTEGYRLTDHVRRYYETTRT
jgi:hypothetical protein